MFLLTTFAHVEEIEIESFSIFACILFENCAFLAACVLIMCELSFEFDCVFASFFDELFDVFALSSHRDWIVWLFSRSVINVVIFCSIVFSNCWKFSNIVSTYNVVVLLDFFVKSINANSKFFFVCIWSIATDTLSVRPRFTVARSIWLIRCSIITCWVFATFTSSNKVFCAFFSVSSIDRTSVRILIESNFFLSAIWRSFSVFLFRLNNSSSLWLEVDKLVGSASFKKMIISSELLFSFVDVL